MAGHTGIWNCHPDLQSEWNSFAEECRQTANSNLNSDLWMNFWRYEVILMVVSMTLSFYERKRSTSPVLTAE